MCVLKLHLGMTSDWSIYLCMVNAKRTITSNVIHESISDILSMARFLFQLDTSYVHYERTVNLFLACTLKHFVHVHVRHPNSLSLGFNILDAIVAIYLSQLLFQVDKWISYGRQALAEVKWGHYGKFCVTSKVQSVLLSTSLLHPWVCGGKMRIFPDFEED